MIKKLVYIVSGVLFLVLSLFFVIIVGHLLSAVVLPATGGGGLSVEGSTMILNILWDGNEIYILLTAYTLLAAAFAWSAIVVVKKAK